MATQQDGGRTGRQRAAILGAAGAAVAAAALALVTAAHGAVGPIIGTAPLAPPLGACIGDCPSPFPQVNNGPFAGRDEAINIFTGGDFTATGRAAEAEGKVVTLGNLTIDKDLSGGASGLFNVGVVGVGSRVPPPDGSDFVTVGGNVDVVTGNTLAVGAAPGFGNLRHAGSVTGNVTFVSPGEAIQDPEATAPYVGLRPYIEDRSACAAQAPANGEVIVNGSNITFQGDGTSPLQVFDVPGDIGGATAADFSFTGIPANATVLVNMTGTNPTINTNTGTFLPDDPMYLLGPRLMWNFPNATTATITGGAQFWGSVMMGQADSSLTLSEPGINGRVYAAGNVTLTSPSTGVEIHAYPFDGDLPNCEEEPTTPTTPTTSETTPTTPSSPSTPSTPSTSPTTLPTVPTTPAATTPTSAHRLAATGDSSLAPALGIAATALAIGAGVLGFTTRKKGSHA